MSHTDTYQHEKNKNLARQMESLMGLSFHVKGGQDAQFIVLSTEVSARGEVYITGICEVPWDDGDLPPATGQVYRFPLTELIFTLDAIKKLGPRLAHYDDETCQECCS